MLLIVRFSVKNVKTDFIVQFPTLTEFKQSGGKPYLSVITGRGNHSQGGVARIKPAVIKYLTSHSFR
jgi:hypothetical protein